MSREYGSYPKLGLQRRARFSLGSGSGCLGYFALALLLAVLFFFWMTRSSVGMETFIPADSAYEAYTTDLLETAQHVAGSRVWDLIPEDRPEYDIRYFMAGGLPLPEWLVRNLFYGMCFVSGNDLEKFQDAVVVTQITRVGGMVERLSYFSGAIETDEAGGLKLRSLPDVGVYYAVRGRVLLISGSRDALIHALSLEKTQAIEVAALAERESELQDADLVLRLRNLGDTASSPLAPLFTQADAFKVALRTEPDQLQISFDASISSAIQQQYHALLDGLQPQPLKRGHEALLGVSWNFGASPQEILARLNSGLAQPIDLAQMLPAIEENAIPEKMSPAAFITAFAHSLGGSGRIMLRGVDQNEILPAPELVGLFEADTAKVQALISSLEPWLEGNGELTYAPFYDAESKTARMPLVGGPSMEFTTAVYGGEALFGTSRPASLALMKEPPVTETLKQTGNLYVVAHIASLAEEIAKAGAQLADVGLLRDMDTETFQQAADKCLNAARKTDTLAAIAAYDKGKLTLELRLDMAAAK